MNEIFKDRLNRFIIIYSTLTTCSSTPKTSQNMFIMSTRSSNVSGSYIYTSNLKNVFQFLSYIISNNTIKMVFQRLKET